MEKKNQWQIHEGYSMTFTFGALKEGLKHSAAALQALEMHARRGGNQRPD